VREAVVDHKIEPLNQDIVATGGVCTFEAFSPNGSYVRCSDRVPFMFGSYRLLRDRFCISMGARAECRHLYTDNRGHYLIQWLPAQPGQASTTVYPVQVTPID
jgi:hypothetical protein